MPSTFESIRTCPLWTLSWRSDFGQLRLSGGLSHDWSKNESIPLLSVIEFEPWDTSSSCPKQFMKVTCSMAWGSKATFSSAPFCKAKRL